MRFWPEIMGARDAFDAIGVRHGLRLRAGAVYVPTAFPGGAAVQVEVVDEELELRLLHAVPVADGAVWIAALCAVLDVPEGLLPPPAGWVRTTDLVVAHDRALSELPTAGR